MKTKTLRREDRGVSLYDGTRVRRLKHCINCLKCFMRPRPSWASLGADLASLERCDPEDGGIKWPPSGVHLSDEMFRVIERLHGGGRWDWQQAAPHLMMCHHDTFSLPACSSFVARRGQKVNATHAGD